MASYQRRPARLVPPCLVHDLQKGPRKKAVSGLHQLVRSGLKLRPFFGHIPVLKMLDLGDRPIRELPFEQTTEVHDKPNMAANHLNIEVTSAIGQ
jgi:hypothetical protein